MLHTITSSPFHSQSLQSCLRYISHEDEILLLQDAVIAAVAENHWQTALAQVGVNIYVLKADLVARGLADKVNDKCKVIDYTGFVSLTEQHETQMKW